MTCKEIIIDLNENKEEYRKRRITLKCIPYCQHTWRERLLIKLEVRKLRLHKKIVLSFYD